MKTIYLDIMEESLSAYTEERIREYITEVKHNGRYRVYRIHTDKLHIEMGDLNGL